ncbi:MAG TPA: metallophosphoesterase [Gaiellales bacterium]
MGRSRPLYVAVVATVLVVAAAAGPALGAANLLPSGGFEGNGSGTLAGWKGVNASLTLQPDGHGGGHAARAARLPGARTYSIAAAPVSAVAERRYLAHGFLRSGRPGRTVCLKLVELTPAGRVAGQAMGCHAATAAWRAFPAVSYAAHRGGDAISLRVVQTSAAAAGDSFQVDALTLTAPGDDARAPTAPKGLTAQATSGTRVTLSWTAATDNVGVAGYTIYRAGAPIATVAGSRTTFTDSGLAPATTYRYAVDAVDASGNRSAHTPTVSATTFAPGDPVIAAAGDIACDPTSADFNGGQGTGSSCQQMATSDIIEENPAIAAVLALGDDQYGCGGYSAFQASFDPSWGRFKSKIHPVPGNHEYQTNGGSDCAANAAGYFKYFGAAAGDAQGDYAWNIGAWHMIALNGECGDVGGCDAGSPQGNFLKANLGTSRCTLAYWHEPYYDGSGSTSSKYAYFWNTLYGGGADIVLNGHIHTYGRFAQQDPNGNADPARGIREFIVGTGGEDHGSLNGSVNVQATDKTFGVLELTLHPASYDWKLVSTNGSVLDSGSTACH